MYENKNSFRYRSNNSKGDELNDIEITTINTKSYLLNALMERDLKSIKRLGPLDPDELDYIININPCFLPILYLTKMLSYKNYSSSQLIIVAKKCVDLEVRGVFNTFVDMMNLEHRKQFLNYCLMVDPNILSFYSFDIELLPLHSPPLTVIKNSSADKRELLNMWLKSEYWNGDIGKYLAANSEDLLTSDTTRERYIRGEPTKINSGKNILELLRLADRDYYFRSTSDLRLRSVSVEKAIYYDKKKEIEIEVDMCPCNLDSIIKFHHRAKLVDFKEICITLLRYGRLDALEILYQAGYNFNNLPIDFDLNVQNYRFLLGKVKMMDVWKLHRGCRSLVSMFIKHYPKMMVDEEDMKTFPHHCMDLMTEDVMAKMMKSQHYNDLVKTALKDGNTFPYRMLHAKDREQFRIEVLLSGDLGLITDYMYTSEEIKGNIRNLKAHVIAYYISILKETIESDFKALNDKGDYYISLYLNDM